MSDVDMDGALEALSADLPDAEADVVVDSDASVDDQPSEESFTGFDPDVLPEDMQQVYKSMQADYTRKTQEIAEIRRQYEAFSESGVDPNEAMQAAHLLSRLDSDPEFAREFTNVVNARLEEVGWTGEATQTADTPNVDMNDVSNSLPPELVQEIQEMREFRQQMLEQQQHNQITAELEVAEQTIRATNPDYTDDDMEALYNLAYSTNGDLMAAQEQYHAIQQRLLGNYLQAKQVPHGATPAPGGPSSVPGRSYSNLDDAHKAAMEAVRNIS
jgi:hypothetical protein